LKKIITDKNMKILLVNYMETTAPGGINKNVREIAKNLSERSHEVIVLQANSFNLLEEEFYDGYKIIRIKSRFSALHEINPEMCLYLKNNLKNLNPDIIHIHGYHTLLSITILYLIKNINSKVPIIFSPHFGGFSHDSFAGKHFWDIYNFFGKKFIRIPDMIISASYFEANNIKNVLSVPEDKIRIIPHGVDNIDLTKNKQNEGVINLLYVGYLLELKGIQYALEAIHELVYERNVNVSFKVVGEGSYEYELKKMADKLNLNDFISWEKFVHHSQINKLLEYYKKSDIFLLLSQSENYGIVVPEALTMGTPVIVTKRTALNEFLNEPGCFGVEYPPDPKEVADLIIKIHENDVKVGPFSEKIRTWDRIAEDYEKAYYELIK